MVQTKKTKKLNLYYVEKKTTKKGISTNTIHNLDVAVRVGKNGLNEGVILEINRLLNKHKVIKVKFLNSSINKDNKNNLIKELSEKTNSKIIKKIGFVVVLFREKKVADKNSLKINKTHKLDKIKKRIKNKPKKIKKQKK